MLDDLSIEPYEWGACGNFFSLFRECSVTLSAHFDGIDSYVYKYLDSILGRNTDRMECITHKHSYDSIGGRIYDVALGFDGNPLTHDF